MKDLRIWVLVISENLQGVIDEEILQKIKKLDATDNKSWLCSTVIAQAIKIEKR